MTTGLEPRSFTWVIQDRLAVSDRIGGSGFQHRRVRREEELAWLQHVGVNSVLSLLDGNQNLVAYEEFGFQVHHVAMADTEPETVADVFAAMDEALGADAVVLVHRDLIDDAIAGVLAGYLVHSGLIEDPIVAVAAIQEILKRPLGPEARGIVPEATGA